MKPEVLFGKGLVSSLEDSETLKVDVSATKLSEELDSAEKDQKEINKEHTQEEKSSDVDNNANMDEISTKTKETVEVNIGNEDLENIKTPLIAPERPSRAPAVEEPQRVPTTEVEVTEEIDSEVSEDQAEEAIQALESLKEVISPNLNALRDHHNFIRSTMGLKPSMFYSPEGLTETQNIIRASLDSRYSIESLVEKGPAFTDLERYAVSTEGIQEAITAMGALTRLQGLYGLKINNANRTAIAIAMESIGDQVGMKLTTGLEDALEGVVIDKDGKEIKPTIGKRIVDTLKKWWEAFKAGMKKFRTWIKDLLKKVNISGIKQFFKDKFSRKKVEAVQFLLENHDKESVELEEVLAAIGAAKIKELQVWLEGSYMFEKVEDGTVKIHGRNIQGLIRNLRNIGNDKISTDDLIDNILEKIGASKKYFNLLKSATSEEIISSSLIKDAFGSAVTEKEDRYQVFQNNLDGKLDAWVATFSRNGIARNTSFHLTAFNKDGKAQSEELSSKEISDMIGSGKLLEVYDDLSKRIDVLEKVLHTTIDSELNNLLKEPEGHDQVYSAMQAQVSTVYKIITTQTRVAIQLLSFTKTLMSVTK